MIGRKAIVGLSLLCALMFCAFAAPSAFAAKGTTAFTCAPVKTEAQFADAHCDTTKAGGEGFRHTEITPGTATEITGTNEKTKNSTTEATTAVLEGELIGIKTKVECKTVHSTGTLTNNAGPPMNASGPVTVEYTGCKEVDMGCTVAEPIIVKANGKTKIISESPEEMGVEFSPQTGTTFVEITFSGCLAAGTHKVEGTAIGTPGNAANGKGTTLYFTKAMTEKTLKFGGSAASFEAVETVKMAPVGGVEQNAIALTTTAT